MIAFAIQERAVSENPDAGPNGIGVQADQAYTLEARQTPQAVAFDTTQITSAANYSQPKAGDPCHPLAAGAHPPAVAFVARQSDVIQYGEKTGPLDTDGHTMAVAMAVRTANTGANGIGVAEDVTHTLDSAQGQAIATTAQVRRLTPVECARLQGFPDTYLDIIYRGKPAADGPKYRALGNSMAVPVMRWIGHRIQLVEALIAELEQERVA